MYDSNERNPHETGIKELDDFLLLLADLDEEIELFAIGGTAMVLKGIKEATKDIDFITTKSYDEFRKMLSRAGLEERSPSQLCNIWYLGRTRIDLFYGSFILGVQLPDDWKELSESLRKVGRVTLYILNWYDIIITKIARCEKRDIDDALKIIRSQKLDFKFLKKRYFSIADTSLITEYKQKFQELEDKT